MLTPQFILALSAKLVIDLFAGGGASPTSKRPSAVAANYREAVNGALRKAA
jgi:hypothetical protein